LGWTFGFTGEKVNKLDSVELFVSTLAHLPNELTKLFPEPVRPINLHKRLDLGS
jgi:hypothetical protein